jgi:eukaryotic-like serine/threonine-protein kinase
MTPERWREVTQIYGAVVSQAPDRRAAAVAELCGADEELRREIESLLASQHGTVLLDGPAATHPSVVQLLTVGSQLGVFRIDDLLGVGGMGEVYRAHDTKLNRDVAIKILPSAFATDPERLARFKREAQLLASLNHPHIAQIYGLEEQPGASALVLELVDGPTLADRIAKGPIPLDQALQIARQIAEALEAAHEKGIVHRDLKPANIAFAADDKIKVLDFGLAKAVEAAPPTADLTRSPTLSMMATQAGFILGTAAYMSPEQAKGLPADHRADVFSFGVVLYEMLTRHQPFRGETAADILASVLVRDADLRDLSSNLNPRLPDLIRRCLDKNLKRRWQAMGDVRTELELIAAAPTTVTSDAGQPRHTAWWTIGITAVITAAVVGLLSAYAAWRLKPSQPNPVTRFSLSLPADQHFTNLGRRSVAISPDGTRIAYVANRQLFLRSLADFESAPVRGTEATTAITNPVFSPDGKFVAYWSEGTIRKVGVTGGAPMTLCAAALNPLGMNWKGGSLLFSQGAAGIMRVAAAGGQPEVLIESRGGVVQDPQFVLDERAVLFAIAADNVGNKSRVFIQSIPSGDRKIVVEDAYSPTLLDSGQLLFARGGILFAAPFDARRLSMTAEAVPVVEGVRRGIDFSLGGFGQYAVSNGGSLAYLPGPATLDSRRRSLVIGDLKGEGRAIVVPPAPYNHPRVSPDGRWLAVDTDIDADASIYLYDLSGTAQIRRLTLKGHNRFPAWSPDSARVTFQSDVEGDAGLFWQRADGVGPAQRLTKSEPGVSHVPEVWTADGKTLLFAVARDGVFTLHSYSKADGRVTPFGDVRSIYPPTSTLSPDGRWLAYYLRPPGSVSGSLVVQPFPSGERQEIAKGGGIHPIWIPHSQPPRLLYRLPGAAYIVEITTQPVFAVSTPVEVPLRQLSNPGPADSRTLDITPDGQHVVAATTADVPIGSGGDLNRAERINVVQNWIEELKQKVPVR